jgi:outer membrane immunogenic protein
MSRKLGLGLTTAFLFAVSSPLFAADMPVKAPAAPPPPALSWSGFYVGVEGGWEQREADWATNCVQLGGPFTCGSALNAVVFPGAPDSTANFNFKNTDWRGAVYNGFMFQPVAAPNLVLGFEWDWGWSRKSSTVAGILGCSTAACTGGALVPFNLSGDSTTIKWQEDYSFRPRVGYLVLPNLQAYVTGGVAVQKVTANETCTGATSPACFIGVLSQTNTANLLGYSVGGGLEWQALPHWILRAEYRYNDYGNWKTNFFVGSGQLETFNTVHVKTQYAQVGLSYLMQPGSGLFGIFGH